MEPEVREMLRINEEQRKYYEQADGAKESEINGFATNLWRRWRARALSVFEEGEIDGSLARLHLDWIGDRLPSMKVLDLGVGYGNPLSGTLAREAREYIAIDLSDTLVKWFRQQLESQPTRNARAFVADFLSDEFTEKDFDLVYARAVFHHFKHFDAFLEKLRRSMAPGGMVITLDDPLETWLPMKLLRMAYRPFQTDADWEYPFTHASLRSIQRQFDVEKVQGTYGFSKWGIPLGFVAPQLARRRAMEWHRKDLAYPYDLGNVTSCLRASLLLRPKPAAAT
jgi:2-polyprenyl-3-methyl-5-hydroxy-6-metoxy-1,4-benzoquinol methylase